MLMPAGVLVLIVLGAIMVDFAVVFLGEREVANAAAGAANDAAVAAISEEHFQKEGEICIDWDRALQVAHESYAARSADFLARLAAPQVDLGYHGDEPSVTVSAEADIDMIFSSALPGVATRRTVSAVAVAAVAQDPALPLLAVRDEC